LTWTNKTITRFLFFLLTFSTSLFSKEDPSNFSQESFPIKFECPYKCGTWGSKSLLSIEWGFVLVLHHVDQLLSTVHYLSDGESIWDPDVSHWLRNYPPPANYNSSWY